ncbi:peptidylprolyl isomerase, partial [Candidatus Omnitrophota bacterium]
MKEGYFEESKARFMTPELWRASHILVPTEDEAKDVLKQLSEGQLFEQLARGRSQDATSERGGDIGFFARGQLVPGFEEAVLK